MVWKKVTEKNTIVANSGKEFDVNGKKIAIFNQECPSHFWHYNIKTGELQDYLKDVKLQTYTVEERNDGIYIDL